ncbi:MAG: DUF4417 domain-containing protein [Clostridia bacterium]|nr:DUF4417 domain-containing protein [Clostridia bacterium]
MKLHGKILVLAVRGKTYGVIVSKRLRFALITQYVLTRWGNLTSFNFCFDGIEKGCAVAVSTIGVKKEKSHFMLGYDEMLSRIKPSKIICYGKPFDEMKGDIIEVDYAKTNNLRNANKNLYIKTFYGYVNNTYTKGGGSADGQSSGNPEPRLGIIPQKGIDDFSENIRTSFNKYEESGWKGARKDQTPQTKGGGLYKNVPPKLRKFDSKGNEIKYREFDVNSKTPGKPRDKERFIRGSDGRTYYTDDHYETFTEII